MDAPVGPVKDAPVGPAGPVTDAPVGPAGPVKEAPAGPAGPVKDAPVGPAGPVKDAPVGPVGPRRLPSTGTIRAPGGSAGRTWPVKTKVSPGQIVGTSQEGPGFGGETQKNWKVPEFVPCPAVCVMAKQVLSHRSPTQNTLAAPKKGLVELVTSLTASCETIPSVLVKISLESTKSVAAVASFWEQISNCEMFPFMVVVRVPRCIQKRLPLDGKR